MTVPSVNRPTQALSTAGSVIAASSVKCWQELTPRYTNAASPVPSCAIDIWPSQQTLLYLNIKYVQAIGPNCITWQICTVAPMTRQQWSRQMIFVSMIFVYIFFVLVLRYNKTNTDWSHCSSLKIFSPQFAKMLPSVFDLGATFYELRRKNFQWLPRRQSLQGVPKNDPICFCQNFIKKPNLIIFSIQIAKTIEICKVHSMSTSHSLCQHTTV